MYGERRAETHWKGKRTNDYCSGMTESESIGNPRKNVRVPKRTGTTWRDIRETQGNERRIDEAQRLSIAKRNGTQDGTQGKRNGIWVR